MLKTTGFQKVFSASETEKWGNAQILKNTIPATHFRAPTLRAFITPTKPA